MTRGSTTRRGIPPPQSPTSQGTMYQQDAKLVHRRQRFALTKAKLSRVIEIASFMGGFSMIALVELKISEKSNHGLMLAFAVITVLLGAMCGFMILFTAWILPHLRADEEIDYVLIETRLIQRYNNHRLFKLENKLVRFVQISWIAAGIGSVLLFIIDVIIVFWLKFAEYSMKAVYSGHTILSIMLIILLVLGIMFRKVLLQNEIFESEPEDIENADTQSISGENQRYLSLVPQRRSSMEISMNPSKCDYSASLHHVIVS